MTFTAGFDFGCANTNADYTVAAVTPPLASQGHIDGIAQMKHFVKDDGLNIFRLPVCWQYLVNNKLGGALDATNAGIYDELVQGCLGTGASCVIDIHNYARWGGVIVGQSNGAVATSDLVSVWTQLYVVTIVVVSCTVLAGAHIWLGQRNMLWKAMFSSVS